jgi:hypothetical protein
VAENEAHLLRRPQLRAIGPEGRARLGEIERAEHVAEEEAVFTLDFWHHSTARLSRHFLPRTSDDLKGEPDTSTGPKRAQEVSFKASRKSQERVV